MVLQNKLGIDNAAELAREEEKISKKKAIELFEIGLLDKLTPGEFSSLSAIHKYLFEITTRVIQHLKPMNYKTAKKELSTITAEKI